MKIIPSEKLVAHLKEQNVTEPEGGFEIADSLYLTAKAQIRFRHPTDSPEELKDRIDYYLIWNVYGVAANNGTRGAELQNTQKVGVLTTEFRAMKDEHAIHFVNITEAVSGAGSKVKEEVRAGAVGLGWKLQETKDSICGELQMLQSNVGAATTNHTAQIESVIKKAILGFKVLCGFLLGLLITLIVLTAFSYKAHAQYTNTNIVKFNGDNQFWDSTNHALKVNVVAGGAGGGVVTQATGTNLHMVCDSGCGGAASYTDSSAFTFGTTPVNNISAVVDDVGTNTVAENSAGAVRMGSDRILYVKFSVAQPVTLTSTTVTGNVASTVADGANVTLGAKGDAKNSATDTTAITVMAVLKQISASVQAPPSQAVTNAGTFAVQAAEADGANVTLGAKADAKSAATDTTAVSAMSVLKQISASVQAPPSQAVTNAGTFVTQSAVTAASGAFASGSIASGALASGSVASGAVASGAFASGSVSDGAMVTLGAKADAKSTATDTTAVTIMSVLKEISAMVQAPASTPVTNAGTFAVQAADVGTLADNGAAAATNRVATLPGIVQTSYNNGTASTQGRNAALNVGTDGLLWTANLPAIRPASYVASSAFAGSSTTDNAVMPGNASNTVLVTMVKVSCTQTTAGSITLTLVKRSAADTSGTSASMTAVPDDSNYASAVSAPLSYTGTGPTVGTPVGNVDNVKLGCEATSTAAPQDIYILNRRQKPIVLRGTAQQLAVNAGGAITGGNITVTFEWIETATILP